MENKNTTKGLVNTMKDNVKNDLSKLDEFWKKEMEFLPKNVVVALFCGLPFLLITVFFAMLGLGEFMMFKISFGIIFLVFCSELAFDAVKLYVEDKRTRIEYYVTIAISSTLLLGMYWLGTRVMEIIKYGG